MEISVQSKIEQFKSSLNDTEMSDSDIVRQYLCFWATHIFKDDHKKYFLLKNEIAKAFEVYPNEVIMIGSGKLGFSIASYKLWKEFDDKSDIDIAIISEKAFDKYWDELIDYNIKVIPQSEKERESYQKFIEYLSQGWLRPDYFPFKYKNKKKWFDFFRDLRSQIFQFGDYKISAGLFRNFHSFEQYHARNIKKLRINIRSKQ